MHFYQNACKLLHLGLPQYFMMNDKLVSFYVKRKPFYHSFPRAVAEAVPSTFFFFLKKALVVSLIRKHLQGSYGSGGIKQTQLHVKDLGTKGVFHLVFRLWKS